MPDRSSRICLRLLPSGMFPWFVGRGVFFGSGFLQHLAQIPVDEGHGWHIPSAAAVK